MFEERAAFRHGPCELLTPLIERLPRLLGQTRISRAHLSTSSSIRLRSVATSVSPGRTSRSIRTCR